MDTYTYDEMYCCQCKRRYSLTLQASNRTEAIRLFKEICYGAWKITGHYFTLPVKTWIEPTPCSNCGQERIQVTMDETRRPPQYKPKMVMVQDGQKWRQIKQGEYRPAKETKTLADIRANKFEFTIDPNPDAHVIQCECSICYKRKASVIQEKQDIERRYQEALKRCGL